ncbi:MAG: iron-containing alcohol dehydrogenase family protein [Chitinophagaceae bacterium]|nr:iron-containing alcohol dehydrogenase family protein [Chitinophagaceae bacterium]
MFKNIRNIEKILFGRGSYRMLKDIIEPNRNQNNGFFLFIVDHFFHPKNHHLSIPAEPEDAVVYIDVDPHEPTTEQVDHLRDEIKESKGIPAGVIGIGGGSILDIAKAVSLMFTNEGSSAQYQGLNLIKNPGVYHVGVPTISGTGAECSSTAVLTGPQKKLGIKCEWTVFDQVILDPELTATVPAEKWFYTGMDTYIHCIESEKGIMNNAFSRAFADEALKLCREVYLGASAGQTPENDDKLMVASLMGGMSLTYSEVGVCHALSYGLSKILGYRHGYANCVAFQHLNDFYPEGVSEFQQMLAKHKIRLPQHLSREWSESQIHAMAEVAYNLPHMWHHALGDDWKNQISVESVTALYKRL